MTIEFIQGDCREKIKEINDNSIHCVVTSPPYFGLRDYGDAKWQGGNINCKHDTGGRKQVPQTIHKPAAENIIQGGNRGGSRTCKLCGAIRVDKQIGLEETVNEYIENLVNLFRDIRRVLRHDGIAWLNLGDSYATGDFLKEQGFKNKDLILIPSRVAIALVEDGWYLRSDIIWEKPNPLPESVKDRPTSSYEHVFMLTKSSHYFYDQEAIREPYITDYNEGSATGRNSRNIWKITPKPFKGAHFAVFPPELAEKCILAGTSDGGVCVECETPYVREFEKIFDLDETRPQAKKAIEIYKKSSLTEDHLEAIRDVANVGKNKEQVQILINEAKEILGGYFKEFTYTKKKFIGWKKNCKCSIDEVKSSIVLDPFSGSGTTGLVAKTHNRNAILIELNQTYIDLAKERLSEYFKQDDIDNVFSWT